MEGSGLFGMGVTVFMRTLMAIIQENFCRPAYLGDQAEKVLQLRSLLAEKFPAIEARAGGALYSWDAARGEPGALFCGAGGCGAFF